MSDHPVNVPETPRHPTSTKPAEPLHLRPTMHCRQCGYDLRGQPPGAHRCPECGRPFDPADPRTFRTRPPRRAPILKHAAIALLSLALLFSALWGWFYWGWHDQQQALAEIHCTDHESKPLNPWLKARLGRAGFVLDRVTRVGLSDDTLHDIPPAVTRFSHLRELILPFSHIRDLSPLKRLKNLEVLMLTCTDVDDLTPLAGLTSLRMLFLDGTPVKDLSPLARLTNLEHLEFNDTPVGDLTPLARLSKIRELQLSGTSVRDLAPLADLTQMDFLCFENTRVANLSPLAGLKNLSCIHMDDTAVRDLSPLAGLPELRSIWMQGCPVRDLTPLARNHSLWELRVSKQTITGTQLKALKKALPTCWIERD